MLEMKGVWKGWTQCLADENCRLPIWEITLGIIVGAGVIGALAPGILSLYAFAVGTAGIASVVSGYIEGQIPLNDAWDHRDTADIITLSFRKGEYVGSQLAPLAMMSGIAMATSSARIAVRVGGNVVRQPIAVPSASTVHAAGGMVVDLMYRGIVDGRAVYGPSYEITLGPVRSMTVAGNIPRAGEMILWSMVPDTLLPTEFLGDGFTVAPAWQSSLPAWMAWDAQRRIRPHDAIAVSAAPSSFNRVVKSSADDLVCSAGGADGAASVVSSLLQLKGKALDLYALLRSMRPTKTEGYSGIILQYNYDGAALIDGQPVLIVVTRYSIALSHRSLRGIGLFAGHTMDLPFDMSSPVLVHDEAQVLEHHGPGTHNFGILERVLANIRERLSGTSPETEAGLRAHFAETQKVDAIEVHKHLLYPERFGPWRLRLEGIEAGAERTPPVASMPEAQFARAVARIIKARFPQGQKETGHVTGDETSLSQLKAHGGIQHSGFDHYYRGSECGGQSVLDLEAIASGPFVDHGWDPIRNRFYLIPVREHDGAVRFSIRPHEDEGFGDHLVPVFLNMYAVLLDEGLPISMDGQVSRAARGEAMEKISRTDPRVAQLGIELPQPPEPNFSRPIQPGDDPSALPPMEELVKSR